MIDNLLRSLNDYVEAKKELSTVVEKLDTYDDGYGLERYYDDVAECAADFENSLNEFVDKRIAAALKDVKP